MIVHPARKNRRAGSLVPFGTRRFRKNYCAWVREKIDQREAWCSEKAIVSPVKLLCLPQEKIGDQENYLVLGKVRKIIIYSVIGAQRKLSYLRQEKLVSRVVGRKPLLSRKDYCPSRKSGWEKLSSVQQKNIGGWKK